MKDFFRIVTLAVCCCSSLSFTTIKNIRVDRAAIYAIMAKPDLTSIDNQLNQLQNDSTTTSSGFKGALVIMKAGVVKGSFKKLQLFNRGKAILEEAIKANASNVEFHLLRLMIQENAPSIVHYNQDIQTDSELVQKSFKQLPDDVQKVVVNYSKISKALAGANFAADK